MGAVFYQFKSYWYLKRSLRRLKMYIIQNNTFKVYDLILNITNCNSKPFSILQVKNNGMQKCTFRLIKLLNVFLRKKYYFLFVKWSCNYFRESRPRSNCLRGNSKKSAILYITDYKNNYKNIKYFYDKTLISPLISSIM